MDAMELRSVSTSQTETSAIANAAYGPCGIHRVKQLYLQLSASGAVRREAEIMPFMAWLMTLPNVTLRVGAMEDPHDFLVPLWQVLTMAAGGSLSQCGVNCRYLRVHEKLMSISLCHDFLYECINCGLNWIRHDDSYKYCMSFRLLRPGTTRVHLLLHDYCVLGSLEQQTSLFCGCTVPVHNNVRARSQFSYDRSISQGKGVAIHVNSVYFVPNLEAPCRYIDRRCLPDLYIRICDKVYILDSFIEFRPLSPLCTSADVGHYVAYIRLSERGDIWKLANDGYECLINWLMLLLVTACMYLGLRISP